MPIPNEPINLIPRPFAAEGTFQVVSDDKIAAGRASFKDGFPNETQLPMNQGGIAPNRMDFNGLFNMLSTFAFWQQSGGQFTYKTALNYKQPSIVFHNGKLWWCVADNGPDVAGVGEKVPGTNENYWLDLLKALAQMGSSGLDVGVPVGTIITFYGTAAPTGYLACNGASFSASTYPKLRAVLGKSALPDLRGYFVRGYDTRNTVDPDGAARAIGSVQADAMQRIRGGITTVDDEPVLQCDVGTSFTGPFYSQGGIKNGDAGSEGGKGYYDVQFDSARVTRTDSETRPKNVCLLFCIKHD